jgi:hypothetical protein
MPTEKQIAASRANGAKSRGPVTDDGKRRSARSNTERALLTRTVVLDGESRERFDALLTALNDELKPETVVDHMVVQKVAVSHWRLMRAWAMESARIAHEANSQVNGEIADPATRDALAFGKLKTGMSEYEMRCDRQFTRALHLLEKLRAGRTREAIQSKDPGPISGTPENPV